MLVYILSPYFKNTPYNLLFQAWQCADFGKDEAAGVIHPAEFRREGSTWNFEWLWASLVPFALATVSFVFTWLWVFQTVFQKLPPKADRKQEKVFSHHKLIQTFSRRIDI